MSGGSANNRAAMLKRENRTLEAQKGALISESG